MQLSEGFRDRNKMLACLEMPWILERYLGKIILILQVAELAVITLIYLHPLKLFQQFPIWTNISAIFSTIKRVY